MKKTLAVFLALLLTITLLPLGAYAEGQTDHDPQAAEEVDPEVKVGIDPQSPFWFLQRLGERLRLTLTFRLDKQTALQMEQLRRRELEIDLLRQRLEASPANHRAISALEKVMDNFNLQAERATARMDKMAEKHQEKAEKLEQRLEDMFLRQQQRLEKLEETMDSSDIPINLERALDKGRKGLERQAPGLGKGKQGK